MCWRWSPSPWARWAEWTRWLAHRAESAADLVDEERGLLEGGEVAAPVGLAPVAEVGVLLLGPPSRWPEDLLGEHRRGDRHVDRTHAHAAEALPVEPRRRRARAGQPVRHHVVEHPVA